MEGDKKRLYFQSTKDKIGREYEDLVSSVISVLKQSAAIIRRKQFKKIIVIIDESLLDSEKFCKFIEEYGPKADNIIGIYIPEEEEIIERLVELGDDKVDILDELRKYGNERTVKILDKLDTLESKYNVSISIEVLHKPRIESIVESANNIKPDIVVVFRDYLKERDRDISSTILELIHRLDYPILLVG